MRRRFWEPERNSYWILEIVCPLLKILGALIIIGGLITAVGISVDDSLADWVDSDTQLQWAISAGFSGVFVGSIVLAMGAAIDVFMGIDAAGQATADHLDRLLAIERERAIAGQPPGWDDADPMWRDV